MILSDSTIRHCIDNGSLVIEPLEENAIQPASIDLRLGNSFLTLSEKNATGDYAVTYLDEEVDYEASYQEDGYTVTIPPLSFALATTKERVELPDNLTAFVEGRSSIGRLGLFIQNAGWVDPGFKGQITLELFNASNRPIALECGRRICQLVFAELDRSAKNPYRGKYQNQREATGSRIHKDKEV